MTTSSPAEQAVAGGSSALPPIIIDLGKLSRKKVKRLKKGEGVYVDEVTPAIAQVRASLEKQGGPKEVLPVVVIYEKKPRKSKLPFLKLLP